MATQGPQDYKGKRLPVHWFDASAVPSQNLSHWPLLQSQSHSLAAEQARCNPGAEPRSLASPWGRSRVPCGTSQAWACGGTTRWDAAWTGATQVMKHHAERKSILEVWVGKIMVQNVSLLVQRDVETYYCLLSFHQIGIQGWRRHRSGPHSGILCPGVCRSYSARVWVCGCARMTFLVTRNARLKCQYYLCLPFSWACGVHSQFVLNHEHVCMHSSQVDIGEGVKPPGYYVQRSCGLFPAPLPQDSANTERVEKLFHFMGTFFAKCIQDNRLVDIPLSRPLLKLMCMGDVVDNVSQNYRELLCRHDSELDSPNDDDLTPTEETEKELVLDGRKHRQLSHSSLSSAASATAPWYSGLLTQDDFELVGPTQSQVPESATGPGSQKTGDSGGSQTVGGGTWECTAGTHTGKSTC